MNSELMMKIAAGLRKDGLHHDADRLEAIAKAQVEPVAWVTPLRHGQQVTFYKPATPDNGFGYEGEQEWYCYPLYREAQPSPAADVLVEALECVRYMLNEPDGMAAYLQRFIDEALAAYEKERTK